MKRLIIFILGLFLLYSLSSCIVKSKYPYFNTINTKEGKKIIKERSIKQKQIKRSIRGKGNNI